MSYNENDVVIVSTGALLPGARDPKEFFDSLLEGQCRVHDLRDAEDLSYRPLYSLIHETDRKAHDATYSTMGADIPRMNLIEIAARHKLVADDSLFLHVMALEAVRQCLDDVIDEKARKNTDLIFGSADALTGALAAGLEEVFEEVTGEDCFSEVEKEMLRGPIRAERARFAPFEGSFSPPELCIPSNLSEKIMDHFGLGGVSFLVDAACASSMAALYLAQLRLQRGLCDFAVVGGADDCLGSGNMLSGFSKLGVLSESGPLPFDERSDGTVIGEGAVAFLVTTLGRAKKMNLPILGIVRGIGGSSDGKAGGLTEPTVSGQVRCYENAYGTERPDLAYIECHGTGTVVGDQIEITSLSQFFTDRRIPIGSVKFNVGHTMIAAGATSLLKALGILERKMIPPSRYFKKYPAGVETQLFLNNNVESISDSSEPLNIGVSSFGFGGTNFHLWLQEYKPQAPVEKTKPLSQTKIVLCGEVEASIDQVAELFSHTNYNIPPKIWPFIDRAQLLSVLLAEKLFRETRVRPSEMDQHRVHVISGAAQPLTLAREMVQRGLHKYAYRLLKQEVPTLEKKLFKIYERVADESTELNEQSAIGSINSLIASRVSKAFDFRGLNFTIDGDGSAGIKALEMARTVLTKGSGAAIVLDSMKNFDEKFSFLRTFGMKCYLVATEDFAQEFNLPILAEINPLTFEHAKHANT
jgi:acyl transferase domain-containing protein